MQIKKRMKDKRRRYKMEGCNRELMEKQGMRQPCVCFLLIQTRFHKDPHDCLITRGMKWRDESEASRHNEIKIDKYLFSLPVAAFFTIFFFQWRA